MDIQPVTGNQKFHEFIDPIDNTPGQLLLMGMDLSYFQEYNKTSLLCKVNFI